MPRTRIIRKGPRKSEQEVSLQFVEDLVNRKTGYLQQQIDCLQNKMLFYQEQNKTMAEVLSLLAAEAADNGNSLRRTLDDNFTRMAGILADAIPVESWQEYAELTYEQIVEHVRAHSILEEVELTGGSNLELWDALRQVGRAGTSIADVATQMPHNRSSDEVIDDLMDDIGESDLLTD